MDEIILDFRADIAKYNAAYAQIVRVPEAMRAELATAVAAERARLTAQLVKPAPAPVPRRQRNRTITSILRQASKAGAARVEYGGAVFHLTGSAAPAAPGEAESPVNEWKDVPA